MKANELMIGNYVNYEQTTHVIRTILNGVTTSHWLNDKNDVYTHPTNDIKPIPLTEEWLIKLGFEKIPHKDQYAKDKLVFGTDFIQLNKFGQV